MLDKFSHSRVVIDALADVCNGAMSAEATVMNMLSDLVIMSLAGGVIRSLIGRLIGRVAG